MRALVLECSVLLLTAVMICTVVHVGGRLAPSDRRLAEMASEPSHDGRSRDAVYALIVRSKARFPGAASELEHVLPGLTGTARAFVKDWRPKLINAPSGRTR